MSRYVICQVSGPECVACWGSAAMASVGRLFGLQCL